MAKHISTTMEWDQVVHLATAAYNFFPNEHSKESPFFLMFGRDPRVPLNTLLTPQNKIQWALRKTFYLLRHYKEFTT